MTHVKFKGFLLSLGERLGTPGCFSIVRLDVNLYRK